MLVVLVCGRAEHGSVGNGCGCGRGQVPNCFARVLGCKLRHQKGSAVQHASRQGHWVQHLAFEFESRIDVHFEKKRQ